MFILLDAVDKQRTLPGLAGSYTIIAATAQQKGDTPDVHCEVTIMGVFDQYRLQPQYVTKTKVSIASLMQVNSSRINNMTLWSGSIIAAFDLLNSPPPTPVPTEAKDRLLPIFVMPVVISVTSLCAAVAVTVLACHFQKQRSQQHVENKKLRNLKEDQKQREEEQEMQQRWGQSQRGSMRGASIRAASEADSPAAQHLRERQGTDASEPYATGETPHQMRGDDPDRYASGGAPAYPSGAPTMPMAQSITSPADVLPDSPTGHGGSMAVESQSRSTRIQVGQTPRDFGDSTHA